MVKADSSVGRAAFAIRKFGAQCGGGHLRSCKAETERSGIQGLASATQ